MKRIAVATIVVGASVLLSGCLHGDDDDDKESGRTAATQAPTNEKGAVYFGWLLGTEEPAGVVIWAKEGLGKRGKISAYACDGVGPPQGMAVWFGGELNPRAVAARPVRLRSSSKRETLEVDTYNERLVKGTFTSTRGERHQYMAYPARDGAGIYQVTLDRNLKYAGTSTLGDRVTAQANRRTGLVEGNVTTAGGERIPFRLRTLSFASPANLTASGLSTTYRKDVRRSLVPGEYVAVVAPSSTHWLGRIGTIRTFSSGIAPRDTGTIGEIIGLDKKEFTPTR